MVNVEGAVRLARALRTDIGPSIEAGTTVQVAVGWAENLDHATSYDVVGDPPSAGAAYREGVLDTLVSVLREVCNDDQRSAFQQLIGLAMQGRRG